MSNIKSDPKIKKDGRLPQGWVWAKLGQLTEPSKEKVDPKEIEETIYIGLEHIERDTGKLLNHGTSSDVRSTKSVFHPGDVLYGKLRPYLNKVCLIDVDGVCSTDILVFPDSPHISSKFLAYRMLANDFVAYASQNVSGVQHPRVHFKILAEFSIALPPLTEQKRMVDKIDELLTQLDAGVADLNRVQANLARYKASVLKAACEGRLVPTEAELAKAEGRNYESGEELLQRILAERKKKWEDEHRAKGNDPTEMQYQEPKPPDTKDLHELPEGWVWATVNQLVYVATGATPLRSNSIYWEKGSVPWVTSGSLNNLYIDEADEYITELALQDTNTKLFPEGTLLVAMYGEGRTRGKVSELRIEASTNQACAALLFTEESYGCKPYLKIFFQKNYEDIRRLSSGGVQPNLNLTIIRQTQIPFPPLAEQMRIVNEVERKLSVIQEMETIVTANLKRAKRMRQAILKRAFEGNLVPQDPGDEPAPTLPRRIKSNRHDGKQLDMFSE